jgi:hypothetical protein
MLRRTRLVAMGLLCAGCPDYAGDCHLLLNCDDSSSCDGVCAPAVADLGGWSPFPFVLWQGATQDLAIAKCPEKAPRRGQTYYANPDQATLSCPACSCAPSTGMCVLPETVTVSASPVCPSDPGGAGAPFDPPSGWDGGCTTNDEIAAVECDGGPCLATVGPMAPINAACMPVQAVASKVVTWGDAAFACGGVTNSGACDGPGAICVAAPSTLPPGFSICVSLEGNDPLVTCPDGYSNPKVFYLGGADDRGCSPCECGPPRDDSCSSLVSFYTDDACTMQAGSVTASSSEPVCVSIPDGSPLGSKQASPPIYTSGMCQPSGGKPTGAVDPKHPVTVCCQQ